MKDEIVNRVAQSKLITFDLEAFYPEGERVLLDIKPWLFEELILKEKEFRAFLNEYVWEDHENAYVALHCSSDAIVPGWAYLLVASKLALYAKKVVVGSLEDLETALYQPLIENLEVSEFKDKPVIIKGCSNKPVPQNAYILAMTKIQEVAKSVMYGEACSSVPLYKRK